MMLSLIYCLAHSCAAYSLPFQINSEDFSILACALASAKLYYILISS